MSVIAKPPYEVTETGWGEFAIIIKVFFQDSRESPIVLNHQLRLFPEPGTPISTRRPVMSEKYDEFVFVNPSERFYNCLTAQPERKLPPNPLEPHFTTTSISEVERRQITKLHTAQEVVNRQTERLRRTLHDTDMEIAHYEKLLRGKGGR
jgi:YEATS domain-containing protein 4